MTTLERPLPLNVVLTALVLCCVGGFAFGLTNAMKIDRGGATTSTQPLAEVSGVPVKDAAPALAYDIGSRKPNTPTRSVTRDHTCSLPICKRLHSE